MDEAYLSRLVASTADDSVQLGRDELLQVAPGAVVRELAPGVLLASAADADAVLTAWLQRPPIFVRHVFAVRASSPTDLESVVAAGTPLAAAADPRLPFSVQTRLLADAGYRPFELNERLASAAPAPLDVRHPQQILSVVVASEEAYLGFHTPAEAMSEWAGGARQFKREPGQVSRAEAKLLEALEVFKVSLPSEGEALDLGAAPGGWTRVLRMHGMKVTAVDPAELHPSVASDAGVWHERGRAETFLDRTRSKYVAVVCDIRAPAGVSAAFMVRAARAAAPDALGIVTLKLPPRGRAREVAESLRTLRRAWTVVGARQLFHNRSEVTVALRAGA